MAALLPEALTHSFTPDLQPESLDIVLEVFDRLEAMPVGSPDELHAFMEAWDETSCWVGDYSAKTRVWARRFTEDEEVQARLTNLRENVTPELSRRGDRLARKFLDAPDLQTLEDGPFAPFLRKVRSDVELFREENVELLQREDQLKNEYQKLTGGWTVDFQGQVRTISEMYRFLADSERSVRRVAWQGIAAELARTSEDVEDLFDELLEVRKRIAANADFDNYRDYIFAARRRDYGPQVCHEFAVVVEREVVGLAGDVAQSTVERLELDSFRPWDTFAEPDGGEPLRPFESVDELEEGVERMMRRLDPELADLFAAIRDNLDLDARQGKAQGGFMSWFAWDRRPFIFCNSTGEHDDVVTLIHEAGHAFHHIKSTQAGSKPMGFNMHPPIEFNEVASMSMELLHYDTLDEFYDEEDVERAIQKHLRRVVNVFPYTVLGDQFQHWLYTNPDHTRAERRAKWVELERKFTPHVDRSEIDEETLRDSYHRILHFFVIPFYFLDYAFAQFGALQVAMQAARDPVEALAKYKGALQLGPQRDVRGLYEAAGAQFDPTPETVGAAMDWVRSRLN